MQKRALSLAVLTAIATPLVAHQAQAQTDYEQSNYLAIHVEAEDFSSNRAVAAGFEWQLFDADNSPVILPDDDYVNYQSASGNAFMELLPDRRKNGDERDLERADENGVVGGLWLVQGSGPTLTYAVNFPEPGRYVVHVRTTGHGTEDNSVFAGINGTYANAGPIQVCIPLAQKGNWVWKYQQRTPDQHCGDTNVPAIIDVTSAGVHNVHISAREDGVEFDSFFLIKDKSNETKICSPSGETDISCRNGAFTFPDDFVDFAVVTSAADTHAQAGDTLAVTHTVSNHDLRDASAGVMLNIEMPEGVTLIDDAQGQCGAAGSIVSCDLGYMAASSETEIALTYRFDEVGDATLNASVSSNKTDQNPDNNSDSLAFTVSPAGPDVDLALQMRADKTTLAVGDSAALTLRVSNEGSEAAEDVVVTGTLPSGVAASGDNCTVTSGRFRCDVGALAAGASVPRSLTLDFSAAGLHDLAASVSAAFDHSSGNDSADLAFYSSSGVLFEEQEGLLVGEVEQFATHTPASPTSGWFLSESADETALITADTDNQTAGALEAEAALVYRVFFNRPGTYYFGARAMTAESASLSVMLNDDAANGGLLAFCANDGFWQWSGAGADGSCEVSESLMLTVPSAGEHRLVIGTAHPDLAVDKFILSSSEITVADGAGTDATVYADKSVDLMLTGSQSALALTAGTATDVSLQVTNASDTYAATDVALRVSGLGSLTAVSGDASRCDVIVSEGVGLCEVGILAPGETRDVTVPLLAAEAGQAQVTFTLEAAQSDDDQSNNRLTLDAETAPGVAAGASGTGSSSAGALGWLFTLGGLLMVSLRRRKIKM